MESAGGIDLGRVIRGLRRRADLSQRQLADRAGVPQPTIAKIEASATRDPAWRTVERLVRAMGAVVVVTAADRPASGSEGRDRSEPPAPAEVPHDDWRDAAGRRYPPHLDVVELVRPELWWGAWWASSMSRSRWPLEDVPDVTFDLCRHQRDERRRRLARGATAVVRRLTDVAGVVYVAETADGTRVGELSGHHFSAGTDDALLAPGVVAMPGTVVLDGIFVRPDWRRLGVGRRLVEAVVGDGAGPVAVMAFGYRQRTFLEVCGFTQTRRLMLPRWYLHPGL